MARPFLSSVDPANLQEFAPRICVVGVGGGGCNAINNMVARGLGGVEFICTNTDAQHLSTTLTDKRVQLGRSMTEGLGCGANPDVGRMAAEESRAEIAEMIGDAHMVFITAGMVGGTGTGAAPVVAEICMERGILTVAVVTKPFSFEGRHRARLAQEGMMALQDRTDTLIVIPNQNLFKMIDQNTSVMNAFGLADDVLLAGVKSVTDLMVRPGLINLDFADVQAVMSGMGNAIMGTGQADGDERALKAASDALKNPLLGGDADVRSAKGMLVNITGGTDLTLFEVDHAAQHITKELYDEDANIIFGSSFDPSLEGSIRVSIVATGIDEAAQ
jgi:cell division protein FtsZ